MSRSHREPDVPGARDRPARHGSPLRARTGKTLEPRIGTKRFCYGYLTTRRHCLPWAKVKECDSSRTTSGALQETFECPAPEREGLRRKGKMGKSLATQSRKITWHTLCQGVCEGVSRGAAGLCLLVHTGARRHTNLLIPGSGPRGRVTNSPCPPSHVSTKFRCLTLCTVLPNRMSQRRS